MFATVSRYSDTDHTMALWLATACAHLATQNAPSWFNTEENVFSKITKSRINDHRATYSQSN